MTHQPASGVDDVAARSGRDLVAALQRAIAAGEIEVHYQPIIDLRSGLAVRLEALARWPSACVGPDVFVVAAELAGTVFDLDMSVFEQVLGDIAEWAVDGAVVCVAVNMSSLTVVDGACVPVLEGLLAAHGVDAGSVHVEITETAIVDPSLLAEAAMRLRQQGFRVALDDFGTRYSVLELLLLMAADELKIDRAFVSALADRRVAIIVESLVRLAHDLGLEVVAEGVETAAQFEAMRAMGCDTAQGWFFSRPVPADEIREWLTARGLAAECTRQAR